MAKNRVDLNAALEEVKTLQKSYGKPQYFHVQHRLPGGVTVFFLAGKTALRTEKMVDAVENALENLDEDEWEKKARRGREDSW